MNSRAGQNACRQPGNHPVLFTEPCTLWTRGNSWYLYLVLYDTHTSTYTNIFLAALAALAAEFFS